MGGPYRPYTPIERLGVNAVDRQILRFGWIFRELSVADYGVDAEIEICDDGIPTGRLLKCQIKSGATWFTERNAEGIVFRDSDRHFKYWLGHSLPVVVALYEPKSEQIWWEHITVSKVQRAGGGFKIVIPHDQLLTDFSTRALRAIVGRPLAAPSDPTGSVERSRILSALQTARRTVDIAGPRLSRAIVDTLRGFSQTLSLQTCGRWGKGVATSSCVSLPRST
jgi:hypothetical protein